MPRSAAFWKCGIIHGKGIGNLQRTVHSILSKRTDVVRFSLASAAFGGRGATIVTLRDGGWLMVTDCECLLLKESGRQNVSSTS